MKFFIQTIKGKITFDFALELVNAIESHNYFYPNDKIEYILDDNYKDYAWENKFQEWCPIGSVEFVCGWLKHFYGESMIPKPINVPNALKDQYFTRRFIDEETIIDENFMEDNIVIEVPKGEWNIKHYYDLISDEDYNKNNRIIAVLTFIE